MDTPPMTSAETDSEHLRLLSIFHYVVAGLAALFACIPVIHLVLGLFMLLAPEKMGPQPPPAFIGAFLVLFASLVIVAGWAFAILVFISGRFLAARKHYMFCLVMACVECMFMPFGTVLGVFTILVLARPGAKGVFAAKQ